MPLLLVLLAISCFDRVAVSTTGPRPYVLYLLRSGMSKWDGFLQLNDVSILLFTSEFKLHLPGGPYDFPAPAVVAFMVAYAEVLLPIFLVLGLATRPC